MTPQRRLLSVLAVTLAALSPAWTSAADEEPAELTLIEGVIVIEASGDGNNDTPVVVQVEATASEPMGPERGRVGARVVFPVAIAGAHVQAQPVPLADAQGRPGPEAASEGVVELRRRRHEIAIQSHVAPVVISRP